MHHSANQHRQDVEKFIESLKEWNIDVPRVAYVDRVKDFDHLRIGEDRERGR